jgi:hypothetical protein
MRRTLDAVESAVLVVRTLGDEDAAWEDFLDESTMHKRRLFRQSLRLSQEASALALERAQLQRLLNEHRLSTGVIAGMLERHPVEDWEWRSTRLHNLARQFYEPWTWEACHAEMEIAVKLVNAFQWSTDKQTSGVSFCGWRERQRINHADGTFQFEFYKTFHGYDINDYARTLWKTFTHGKTFQEVLVGHRLRAQHEVMQQIGPNIKFVRVAEQLSDLGGVGHVVYLVFRTKTERGFRQYVRSVCCPELIKAFEGQKHVWPSNFVWFQGELLEGDDRAYKLLVGGSIRGTDVNYANKWMLEAFGIVLRSERMATGRQLITND